MNVISKYRVQQLTIAFMFLASGCYIRESTLDAVSRDTGRTELDMSRSKLTHVPEWIRDFKALEKLIFFKNNITEIPEFIGDLGSLEDLSFQSNSIRSVPPSIGKLKELRRLNLRFNKISELPDEIGNLTKLEELDLRNNELKELPASFGNLTNLEVLRLNDNQLEMLTPQIGKLTNLRFLYIGRNNIEGDLPESISQLNSLVELDVSKSASSNTLPAVWKDLKNLELLIIDRSISVPYEIGRGNRNFRIIVN